MLKFYKAFLFLFVLNGAILLLSLLVLDLRFLIPVLGLILAFNAFLGLFVPLYLTRHFCFSVFPKDDFYGISGLFKQIQQKHHGSRLQLLKSPEAFCLYWASWDGPKVALSEEFLENFSAKEQEIFLSYVFQLEKSGELLLLSLFSAFLFLFQKGAGVLSYPLVSLRLSSKRSVGQSFRLKQPINQGSDRGFDREMARRFDKASLWLLSLFMKGFLYSADQNLYPSNQATAEEKSQQAQFLWRLDSWARFQKGPLLPLFLAPLGLVKPLNTELLGYFPPHKGSNKKADWEISSLIFEGNAPLVIGNKKVKYDRK